MNAFLFCVAIFAHSGDAKPVQVQCIELHEGRSTFIPRLLASPGVQGSHARDVEVISYTSSPDLIVLELTLKP